MSSCNPNSSHCPQLAAAAACNPDSQGNLKTNLQQCAKEKENCTSVPRLQNELFQDTHRHVNEDPEITASSKSLNETPSSKAGTYLTNFCSLKTFQEKNMDPFSSPVLILSAARPRPLHHRSSGLDVCWEVNFFVGAGVDGC